MCSLNNGDPGGVQETLLWQVGICCIGRRPHPAHSRGPRILAFMISPWYRFKVVSTVDLMARFLGQAMIAQLLCGPSSPITGSASPAREMLHLGGDTAEEGFVAAPA
ncbi:unnamed protein product [Prorocentrum cordatum]|uniref:Uncharacterized protein n=1 Tax=Prorocentrum cordatum TaxID=2364126 RepID=A0ABN9SGR5_9DINO|nr:unnamed protein product [Polarella glacialis]